MALQVVVNERKSTNMYACQYNCVLWMRELLLGHVADMQLAASKHLRLRGPEDDSVLAEFWYSKKDEKFTFTVKGIQGERKADSFTLHEQLRETSGQHWDRIEDLLRKQIGISGMNSMQYFESAICKPTLTSEGKEAVNTPTFTMMAELGAMIVSTHMREVKHQAGTKELMVAGEVLRDIPGNLKAILEAHQVKVVSCVEIEEDGHGNERI